MQQHRREESGDKEGGEDETRGNKKTYDIKIVFVGVY